MAKFEGWAEKEHGLTVNSVPALWREAKYAGEAEKERLLDCLKDITGFYFLFLKKSGMTPFSVNRGMAVVMSFLHYYDIPVKTVRIKHPLVQFHNRDITKEEIKQILDHSDVRDRAIFLILYESGIRPATLIKLRWKQIKQDYLAKRIPMKIDLPSEMLKCGVSSRFCFIGGEGFQALDTYLRTRHLPLQDDDFVFVTEKPYGNPLGTHAVSQAFNVLVKKLNLAEKRGNKVKELHLYCLRKAFNKFMAVGSDYRYVEYWEGHTDTSSHYIPSDPEHHRKIYSQGYASLRLSEPQIPLELVDKLEEKDAEIAGLKAQLEELKSSLDPNFFRRTWKDLTEATADIVISRLKRGELEKKPKPKLSKKKQKSI